MSDYGAVRYSAVFVVVVRYLSDNLYSRWRRTCTGHVHGSRAL